MNAVTPTWTLVDSYPFRQPERVFFNPYNQSEMWVTSFGNGMKVGTSNVLGLSEVTFDKTTISIYPNPFNESINFSNSNLGNLITHINVYDTNGRLILSTPNENNSIHTSSFTSGMYVLEFILNDHSKQYRKVVK
jgi:DNA gyrase/topoisomerase IV subunit B